jgi:hypothetical protein
MLAAFLLFFAACSQSLDTRRHQGRPYLRRATRSSSNSYCLQARHDIELKLKGFGLDMLLRSVSVTLSSGESLCTDSNGTTLYFGNCTPICLHRVMEPHLGVGEEHFVYSANSTQHYLLGGQPWKYGLQVLAVDWVSGVHTHTCEIDWVSGIHTHTCEIDWVSGVRTHMH